MTSFLSEKILSRRQGRELFDIRLAECLTRMLSGRCLRSLMTSPVNKGNTRPLVGGKFRPRKRITSGLAKVRRP